VKRLLLIVLAGLFAPAPALAAPPELFVRMQTWDTHEPAGDWLPLASAPALDYLGGYEVGYRLQAGGFQRAALTVAGVPDGQPTQPSNATPFCVARNGAAGDVVAAGPELQFEGSGTYTVTVSVGTGTDCVAAGESSTGSFAVASAVTPAVVGIPLTFRAEPLPRNEFAGVRAPDPPGGIADVRCTLDGGAVVVPRGDFPHPSVIEDVFPRPGAWACVARGTAEGLDDARERTVFSTPWSAPLAVEVRSDFRRRTGVVLRPRARRSRFAFRAEWPAPARGGRGTLTVSRVTGCRRSRYRLRRTATARGVFDAKRVVLAIRRPRAGFYLGRLSFSGTRFIRAGSDPTPLLLRATRGRIGFVDRQGFPPCG